MSSPSSVPASVPLIVVRDSIADGVLIGPRLPVAGNIVGCSGPSSLLFSNATPQTYFPVGSCAWKRVRTGWHFMPARPRPLPSKASSSWE